MTLGGRAREGDVGARAKDIIADITSADGLTGPRPLTGETAASQRE